MNWPSSQPKLAWAAVVTALVARCAIRACSFLVSLAPDASTVGQSGCFPWQAPALLDWQRISSFFRAYRVGWTNPDVFHRMKADPNALDARVRFFGSDPMSASGPCSTGADCYETRTLSSQVGRGFRGSHTRVFVFFDSECRARRSIRRPAAVSFRGMLSSVGL